MGKVQARYIDARTSSQHHYSLLRLCAWLCVCVVSIYFWSAIAIVAIVIAKNILRQPPSQHNTAIRHLPKQQQQQHRQWRQQHMTVISKVVHAGIENLVEMCVVRGGGNGSSRWQSSEKHLNREHTCTHVKEKRSTETGGGLSRALGK